MTIMYAVSPVIFPATEKDGNSVATIKAYKNVIGRQSDWSIHGSPSPFTFKLPYSSSYETSVADSYALKNGFVSEQPTGSGVLYDFVEDTTHIYAVYASGTYNLSLYKIEKSDLLLETQVFETQVLATGASIMYAPPARYGRMMTQDDDYVFVAVVDPNDDNSKVIRVTKSDITTFSTISTDISAYTAFDIYDMCCDDETLYLLSRINDGGTIFSAVSSAVISTFTGESAVSIASGTEGYLATSLNLLEKNVVVASGFDDTPNAYGVVIKRESATLSIDSRVLECFDSDQGEFLSVSSDPDYNKAKVYVAGEAFGLHFIRQYRYAKGITSTSGKAPVPTITCPDVVTSANNFNIALAFNYGENDSSTQNIFKMSDGEVDLTITIDNAFNIILEYDGNRMARGYVTAYKTVYTKARAYQTISLQVNRTDGIITMNLNGENCTVVQDGLYGTQLISIDNGTPEITLGTSDDPDFVYVAVSAIFDGVTTINDDYSNGGIPLNSVDFVSVNAMFDYFSSVESPYATRIEAKKGYIYTPISLSSSAMITIARYEYDLSKPYVSSGDLDGYASTDNNVVRVLGSDDGYIYFLSSMRYVIGYTSFNISRMIMTTSLFGYDQFSFICNARDITIRFAPTSTGVFTDYLDTTDVNDNNLQQLTLIGSAYSPDLSYIAKSPIIKMNEGHLDFLRFADTPSEITVDYYSKAADTYTGTRYAYNEYNADFVESTTGLYKKNTKTFIVQNEGAVYDSWFDTINMFFDLTGGQLLQDNPIAVYAVMGVSSMKAELYFALDTNYNMNDEKDTVSLGDDNDTALLSNSTVSVSGKKQIEIIEFNGLDNRDARSIKFRISAGVGEESDSFSSRYDDFRCFELRYTPTDAIYIEGDNAES